jgi:hypothetical protein
MTCPFQLRTPPNTLLRQDYVFGLTPALARNEIVANALATPDAEVTHIFFVDDDVLFHSDVLLTLLSHARPIVSGLYFHKSPLVSPLIWAAPHQGTASWVPDTLMECWAHGMGLTLIEIEVFRRVRPTALDVRGNPEWFRTERTQVGEIPTDISEDVYFLRHAAEAGYSPLVDTSKEAFGWHFDGKRRLGYPKTQWTEFCERGTVTWPTAQWTDLHG